METSESAVENQDIPEEFRGCVAAHGREMFMLVYNSGMAGQAMEQVAAQAQKHQSRALSHACGVFGAAYNQVAGALADARGWTQEQLAACERDIQVAFHLKLNGPVSLVLPDSLTKH